MNTFQIIDWRFHLGEDRNAWQKHYDDQQWQTVRVPHDWSVTQDFVKEASSGTGYLPGGIGWYRAHYSLAELGVEKDQIVQLRFDGVYKNADVWVNGYHLGNRPSGYSSFDFDITEMIRMAPNDDVVVAVRVDHTDLADSRWYNGSGINRPVTFVVMEEVFVDRYDVTFVTEEVANDAAKVTVAVKLSNHTGEATQAEVAVELRELGGNSCLVFPTQPVTIAACRKQEVVFRGELAGAALWSPATPNLYELITIVKHDGKESRFVQKTGIRTFSFNADTGFEINEEALKLKGVCLHEDAGCFGTAVPTVVWLRRLQKLKDMGANAIRMAHNPHSQNLYDLCDALGFLVFDEAFDEWENPKNKWWQGHNVYPPKFEGYAKDFPAWHKKDLVDMVQRNKNRPAIVAWSIGNEIDYPNDPYQNPLFEEMTGNNDNNKPEEERQYNPNRPNTLRLTTIGKTLGKILRREDPTRPVTLAAAFPELSSQTGLLDDLDVVGYNYKEHLYEADHCRFPDKPFIGSENGHGYRQWLAVVENDYISGQFLWTGIDYLGEAHGWPIHGSGAGLLTMAGFEKSNYWLRKSWWSTELTAKLFTLPSDSHAEHPEWLPVFRKWNYPPATPVEIRLYTNGENITVKNNDEVIPMMFDKQTGYYRSVREFVAGKLTVTATRGEESVHDSLQPLGEATQLVPLVWQDRTAVERLQKNAVSLEEIQQVQLTFCDKDGQRTFTEQQIWFDEQASDCQLLGIENGDLADITPYTVAGRRSYQGQLIAYVAGEPGSRAVFCTEGLPPVTVNL
ncbi:glycoside hydrolase family 2 TIM barrel-domain containing protein [Candidatus Enterococcus leclercqii]|uniref:glycoside hydrolase family 2 TIM barrel-domain containing protein n=1 Tax=Candidatus Enterococcus leclercqii TaxID=1857218 RepID=UPI001379F998|nr:glycoside hydrolase family 2 TIM barrel-domain containing protein [Enterococcus sp. CU9D]KAF1292857.1 beta-galactosidase [Enterococcus sp. CU9D]